jgi:lipopolysaccharide export system permease protein
MDLTTGKLSELNFEQYVLDLNALRNTSLRRLPDPREQTIAELLNPTEEMLRTRTTREHLWAELNQRLASPLLALAYAMIGLAAILSGEFNRRGMGKRILIVGLATIIIQATFMSINNMVPRNLWLAGALHATALIPALIGFMFLNTDMWRRHAFFLRTIKPVLL